MPTSPVRRAVVAAAGSLLVALTVLPTGGSSLAGPALPGGAARTTTEPTPGAAATHSDGAVARGSRGLRGVSGHPCVRPVRGRGPGVA